MEEIRRGALENGSKIFRGEYCLYNDCACIGYDAGAVCCARMNLHEDAGGADVEFFFADGSTPAWTAKWITSFLICNLDAG